MNNEVTVETIVRKVCDSLDLKKIHIARMIGVNESSISNNLSKTLSEVAAKKTGKRLLSLSYVILNLANGIYSKQAIIEGLNEPTISNVLGYKESVLSALQHGRAIETPLLLEKAREGIEIYSIKKRQLNQELCSFVQEALYA